MTNTKEQILNNILQHPRSRINNEKKFSLLYPTVYQDILTWTFPDDFTFTQKLYHYLNNDPELKLGRCKTCGKRCDPSYKGTIFKFGYNTYCSNACNNQNPDQKQKVQDIKKQRYGNPHYNNRSQAIQTWKSKSQEEIQEYVTNLKQSKLEKYGDPNYNNIEKIAQTSKERYGYTTASQNPEIKKRRKQTCNERYSGLGYGSQETKQKIEQSTKEKFGVSSYPQIENFSDIIKKTKLKKHGDPNYNNLEKHRQTCLERYGETSFSKTEEFKEKTKQTCLERYGTEHYSNTQEFIDRTKQKCRERYGTDFFSQSQEYKNNLPKYAEKTKKTSLERYGVEHYSQTSEFNKSHRKRIEYDGITFDSSWEVDVYKYCKEHNLDFEYQPNIQFTYEYEGKTHFYNPDFLIEGQLYEVKGDHFFKDDKMINPFDRSMDGLFEAKHQCILENGVIIINNKIENFLKQ